MRRISPRHRRPALPAVLALVVAVFAAPPLAAQEAPDCTFREGGEGLTQRLSPPDSSSVAIGDGVVKICYGSPSARGREIMGGLVPYGSPWRLGANEPTTLHTTLPIRVGETRLEPGSYSLYAIPGESEWTLVVNAATDRWGVPIDAGVREHDLGSVTAEPERTEEPLESLRIELRPSGEESGEGEIVVAWERTRIRVPFRTAGG